LSKRVAVIGAGVSGLVSAYLLDKRYDITLFEAQDYLGGHTHTHTISYQDIPYQIDTGFIVFNKKTYPYFCQLLDTLNVPIQKSEMSFSFKSSAMGLEYNGHSLNSLFADRKNLFRPAFYSMVKDIARFNREAKLFLTTQAPAVTITDFIAQNNYNEWFQRAYFIPMTAAIWSAKPSDMYHTPADFILNFFENHGLLDIRQRPQWYVIAGGSKNYIAPLIKNFQHKIHLNAPIENIRRANDKVIIRVAGEEVIFDAVVIATHSDQALRLLENPSADEYKILSAISYQKNDVVLHHDASILPKRRLAWASWNYADHGVDSSTLTYYMNKLQNINAPIDFCVSLNQTEKIHPQKIFKQFSYSHPSFTQAAIAAQQSHHVINGKNGIYYCGAYWKYGFHEDGVKSAIDACQSLGVSL
jgi:predicted NAD/FAD-binding protein